MECKRKAASPHRPSCFDAREDAPAHKTCDFAKAVAELSWTSISGNLPKAPTVAMLIDSIAMLPEEPYLQRACFSFFPRSVSAVRAFCWCSGSDDGY